jgi:serine/threonine-protein kinase HipA
LGKLANGLDMRRSVENEHFCMKLCQALGLEVANSQIVDFEDVRVLAIERFDRIRSQDGRLLRFPQEDFCQALSVPATLKYNSDGGPGITDCLTLLSGSDYADQDRLAFLKAQIVFWLIGATDGHAKNFSLFLTPGGRYRMAPLYDIMSAQTNFDAKQLTRREFRLAMAAGDRRHYRMGDILPYYFKESAKSAGVAETEVDDLFVALALDADDALDRTIDSMPELFPLEIADSVASSMRARLDQLK